MKARWQSDACLDYRSDGLDHSAGDAAVWSCCTGLMLLIARKSAEPMAAGPDSLHVRARHHSRQERVASNRGGILCWSLPRPGREPGACGAVVIKVDFGRN